MGRLPVPGSDDGEWGGILNEFLLVSHDPSGNLKEKAAIDTIVDKYTLPAGGIPEADLATSVKTKLNASGGLASYKPEDYGAVADGITDDTIALQAAIDAAALAGAELYLSARYYITALYWKSGLAGIQGTKDAELYGGTDYGWLLFQVDAEQIDGAYVDFVKFTCIATPGQQRACFRIEQSNRLRISNCEFRGFEAWGLFIGAGVTFDSTTTIRNFDVVIENCMFDGTDEFDDEYLLIFNSQNVRVKNCIFKSSAVRLSHAIGLYQNDYDILIEGCIFENPVRGIYFSFTTDRLTFRGNTFHGDKGITGANESDHGRFGRDIVENVVIVDNIFDGISDISPALHLGSVHNLVVSNNIFRNCMVAGVYLCEGFYATAIPAIPLMCRKGVISNNVFDGNNTSDIAHDLNAPITFYATVNNVQLDMAITGNIFKDDKAVQTQERGIVFHNVEYSRLSITGNNGDYDWTGGVALARLQSGATFAQYTVTANNALLEE